MEILVIVTLNIAAILIVWRIVTRRNSSSEPQKAEQQQIMEELRGEKIRLEAQLSSRDEKIAELQGAISRGEAAEKERQGQIIELNSLNSRLLAERENLTQRVEELQGSEDKLEKRLRTQFELISNKIIEDSRNKVNEYNAERLSALMQPFEKEIKDFKEQMSAAGKEQSRERLELETKIKQMAEISRGMSEEAKNLSNALRGNNKTAGNWGETILENILQNSGLTPGAEGYELQEMLRDEEGRAYRSESGHKMIPDAIVHFPDNRNVIIDSKVSIAAYTEYCNAENPEDMKLHLKQHIASIKSHIDSLNVKSYERYVDGSLDFVMMFIPNDFAAMVALQSDLNLWQNAYNKKILIISPTNLITSLKIVSDLWSREKQQQNIETILERGRLLYDKCCTFVDSYKKVGDALQSAQKIYDGASLQLQGKGGIIRQAEMLEKSGIKSKKSLALRSEESKEQGEIELLAPAEETIND